MRQIILVLILLCSSLFFTPPLWSQVQVFHSKPYDVHYSTSFSPDGNHVALSGTWYVRIFDIQGKMVGEYFDRSPRISLRKEFKFWNIHRQKGNLIAFINNKELAIAEKNTTASQIIKVVGLDGRFHREIKVPMKKLPDESFSSIDQIIVSPRADKIITIEGSTGDFVIRDKNFKEIHRVNLSGSNSYSDRYVKIEDIKFLPNGSGFIVKSAGQTLPEGWVAFLTHYDMKGKLIKALMNDQWVSSIDTPYGKVAREKDNRPPQAWDVSPDGKTIAFMGCTGKIDKKLLGTYKSEEIHPPGSFSEHPYKIAYCIRTIDIKSGKHFQSYILEGGDVTLKNRQKNLPIIKPFVRQIFFAANSKDFLGSSDKGLYQITAQGKIKDFKFFPDDTDYSLYYKKKYGKDDKKPIEPEDLYLAPGRKSFASKKLYFLDIEGSLLGQIKTYYPAFSTSTEGSPIRVSHTGRFFTLEMDPAKNSLLWDFKTNTITREKSSIYWDHKDKDFRVSLEKRELRIKYSDAEALLPANLIRSIVPFTNKQIGVSDKGLIILDKEGNAIKKYPKSTYWFRFAMHPSLAYYMVPSVDAKVKKMIKVSITGQKISEYWIGSFISKLLFSPDGSLLIGSHDTSGCISIWDGKGKLVNFPGQKEGRFFDLHPDPIMSMAMTKNNRFLFTGTPDRILVTDLKSGAQATISLFFKNSEDKNSPEGTVEFIVSDSSGRFECSEGVKDRLSIVKEGQNKTTTLWDKYYTKGLLWKFLQGN